jgi:hypothetical protein
MRAPYWLVMIMLMSAPGRLHAQAQPAVRPMSQTRGWGARALPPTLTFSRSTRFEATSHRPFFLPKAGEHTAYWLGFAAGLALSPVLWCDGCGTVSNASTSLLVGLGGAVTGLLLSRAF